VELARNYIECAPDYYLKLLPGFQSLVFASKNLGPLVSNSTSVFGLDLFDGLCLAGCKGQHNKRLLRRIWNHGNCSSRLDGLLYDQQLRREPGP
jgi:hypothetical protein